MKWCENVTLTHIRYFSINFQMNWLFFTSLRTIRNQAKNDTRKQNHSRTQWNVRQKCRNFVFFSRSVQDSIQINRLLWYCSKQSKWNMNFAIKNTALSVEWLIIISCWSTWLFFLSFNHFFFGYLFYRFRNFKIFLLFVFQVRIK